MNIQAGTLMDTTNYFTEAFRHYLCMRMKFRSSVLSDNTKDVSLTNTNQDCITANSSQQSH